MNPPVVNVPTRRKSYILVVAKCLSSLYVTVVQTLTCASSRGETGDPSSSISKSKYFCTSTVTRSKEHFKFEIENWKLDGVELACNEYEPYWRQGVPSGARESCRFASTTLSSQIPSSRFSNEKSCASLALVTSRCDDKLDRDGKNPWTLMTAINATK